MLVLLETVEVYCSINIIFFMYLEGRGVKVVKGFSILRLEA